MSAYEQLLTRLRQIHNLNQASAVLNWDQRTYMPAQGADARARQLSTLAELAHAQMVARDTQDLLTGAEGEMAGVATESDERALLRIVRKNMDKATKLPITLVTELTQTCSLGEEAWAEARRKSDYALFAPWLEKIYALKRHYADCIGYQACRYDALLDDYEEGMTVARLDPLLAELKAQTVPLVAAIAARADRVDGRCLTQSCPVAAQETFSRQVLADCGFDFTRGRLDRSVHPFCTNFSQRDVRLTTRYEEEWLPGALFGCLHEMGHGFYEAQVNPAYEGIPLGGGVSLGVHESQSRLWENLVGRSQAFWRHYYPQLQQAFPQQFATVPLATFYAAINQVQPSLIRVEADEVTYNLHIILRYEMEVALLDQHLAVADAPAAWNDKMQKMLGIAPSRDAEGILQDVHWSGGGIGYFPTYMLGNILASQLYQTAARALPDLFGQIERAEFTPLREWLRTQVHQYGSKYPPAELVQRATGTALTSGPYVRYLQEKYGAIYGF
ncbi:MAG: carboxypeptidase M32 [Phycisphaerae bacterium]